jgi:Kdo2-lipid IVA lauroyltransferase/acyltransferase
LRSTIVFMYYILYTVFYCFSLLPFWVLYGISNVLYYIIYKLLGYRKEVTKNNLTLSFPEKSEAEIQTIMDEFYKNLCDSVVETIKLLSISRKELDKRMKTNWEILADDIAKGRVMQAHLSHLFNWEMGTVAAGWNMTHTFTGLYNQVSYTPMDRLMKKIRSRSGALMIEMNSMLGVMAELQEKNTMWGFIADQNPSEPRRGVWVNFLGRETSFFKGAEVVARRYGNAVYFGRLIKVKRGYYEIVLEKIYDNGRDTKDGEITTAFVRYLEECIRKQPSNWVWSHRRWKHVRPQA